MRKIWIIVLLAALTAAPATADAAVHLIRIREVFPGSTANPNAQFVLLQAGGSAQTQVGGQAVEVFDSTNLSLATFAFPGGFIGPAADQAFILVATSEAETLFGVTADLQMTPSLDASGGKVCFGDPSPIDCVSWGDYSGANLGVGDPFAAPLGIPLGLAAVRDISAGISTRLESTDDTNDSAADFDLGFLLPTNASGTTGTLPGTCGNSAVDGIEQCDDGNADDTDACPSTCEDARCGDGFVHAGVEECDNGAANADTAACKSNCTAQVCGDGFVGPGEGCDDGNTTDGDGCTNCIPDGCGNGTIEAGEQCDDGNAINSDACPNNCQNATCGDGFVQAGVEACDDGNNRDGDGCQADCTLTPQPGCGDGVIQVGEQCDDGNLINGDGCSQNCQTETTPPDPPKKKGCQTGGPAGLPILLLFAALLLLRRRRR